MKTRPILFSAPMVRAILAGKKTQTRRILTNQPTLAEVEYMQRGSMVFSLEDGFCGERCRYGVPGDRLYVKETWRCWERAEDSVDGIRFAADDAFVPIENTREAADRWSAARRGTIGHDEVWRPSIFMRAWMARIFLKVEAVRVHRIQDITLEDARAEGIPATAGEAHALGLFDMTKAPGHEWDNRSTLENFANLWRSINGAESWSANPWTWAITFEWVQP